MIPHQLTLQGSLGIKAGLGMDTLTLDLDARIPPDARTIAIRGDNGSGKSTLLNLGMTPWVEPVHLAGNPYDHFGLQGLRELVWSHAGGTYRSRIEYRQSAKTKSTKAYLHRKEGDDWTPVKLPDNTVSDGKVSTYKACLTEILGTQALCDRIAFHAQGAPKLAEYSDQKDFLRAVLAIDDTDAHVANLKDRSKFLGLYRDAEREKVSGLDGHEARISESEREIAELAEGDAKRKKAKFDAIETAAAARAELNKAMEGDIDRQRIREQRVAATKRLEDIRAQARAATAAAEKAVDEANGRLRAAKSRAREIDEQIGRDALSAERQVLHNRSILKERETIEAASARVRELIAEIQMQESTVETLRAQVDEINELAAKVRTMILERSHVADAGREAGERVVDLRKRAGFVDRVPCRGEGEYASCPALCDAIEAGVEIPAAEITLAEKREEWKRLDAEVNALTEQFERSAPGKEAHQKAVNVLATLRREIEGYRHTAAKAYGLDVAQMHLDEATKTLETLNVRSEEHNERAREEIKALSDALDEAEASKNTAILEGDRRVDQARSELSALPEPEGDSAVILARRRLEESEEAVTWAGSEIERASARDASLSEEIERLRRDLQGASMTLRAIELYDEEIANTKLLIRYIQARNDFLIEAAGPAIAETANRLLNDAYGPRFSIRIVTQKTLANGNIAETLEISVLDADAGLESSFLHKSGGESVWLDKALTESIAIYHQGIAGVRYECLFADEAEDGLTAERKSQYFRMDKAAMELGGYERKFFVSHHPDAWEYADFVIDMDSLKAEQALDAA